MMCCTILQGNILTMFSLKKKKCYQLYNKSMKKPSAGVLAGWITDWLTNGLHQLLCSYKTQFIYILKRWMCVSVCVFVYIKKFDFDSQFKFMNVTGIPLFQCHFLTSLFLFFSSFLPPSSSPFQDDKLMSACISISLCWRRHHISPHPVTYTPTLTHAKGHTHTVDYWHIRASWSADAVECSMRVSAVEAIVFDECVHNAR